MKTAARQQQAAIVAPRKTCASVVARHPRSAASMDAGSDIALQVPQLPKIDSVKTNQFESRVGGALSGSKASSSSSPPITDARGTARVEIEIEINQITRHPSVVSRKRTNEDETTERTNES